MSAWNREGRSPNDSAEFDSVADSFQSHTPSDVTRDDLSAHGDVSSFPAPFSSFPSHDGPPTERPIMSTTSQAPSAQSPQPSAPQQPAPTNNESPLTSTTVGSAPVSDDAPATKSGPPYMMLGTLAIIGAMAANVIGFRRSRWAVGKDVHRAWRNYEQGSRQRTENAAAAATAEREAREAARDFFGHAAYDHAEREAAADMAREQAEAIAREAQVRAERAARQAMRHQHETWERTFDSGGGGGGGASGNARTTRVRIEYDRRVFDDLLNEARTAWSSTTSGGSKRTPFGMPEEMLNEMLREAEKQAEDMRRTGRTPDNSDAFRFWERMQNKPGFEGAFGDMGGRGGEGPFGRMGLSRYYSVLGLQSGASDAEVKAAYRKEAMKWHPDRYRGGDKELADRKFREVTEAYNAITRK